MRTFSLLAAIISTAASIPAQSAVPESGTVATHFELTAVSKDAQSVFTKFVEYASETSALHCDVIQREPVMKFDCSTVIEPWQLGSAQDLGKNPRFVPTDSPFVLIHFDGTSSAFYKVLGESPTQDMTSDEDRKQGLLKLMRSMAEEESSLLSCVNEVSTSSSGGNPNQVTCTLGVRNPVFIRLGK